MKNTDLKQTTTTLIFTEESQNSGENQLSEKMILTKQK